MEVEFLVLGVDVNLKFEFGCHVCTLNPICPLKVCCATIHVWKLKMKRNLTIVVVGGKKSNSTS
jgi:hypothetical protein